LTPFPALVFVPPAPVAHVGLRTTGMTWWTVTTFPPTPVITKSCMKIPGWEPSRKSMVSDCRHCSHNHPSLTRLRPSRDRRFARWLRLSMPSSLGHIACTRRPCDVVAFRRTDVHHAHARGGSDSNHRSFAPGDGLSCGTRSADTRGMEQRQSCTRCRAPTLPLLHASACQSQADRPTSARVPLLQGRSLLEADRQACPGTSTIDGPG
jgi:hypothetical protein